jgi:hypothetical protein
MNNRHVCASADELVSQAEDALTNRPRCDIAEPTLTSEETLTGGNVIRISAAILKSSD